MCMSHIYRSSHTFFLKNRPVIAGWSAVSGKKESEGPLSKEFDITSKDAYWGMKTWEQAEHKMQQLALQALAKKTERTIKDFQLIFSGDLLNQ